MTANRVSIAEITAKAINILCRELGAVNTVRFLNQFSTGFGDYTQERDQILGDATVEQLVAEIKQRRETRATKAKTRPKRPRSTKR